MTPAALCAGMTTEINTRRNRPYLTNVEPNTGGDSAAIDVDDAIDAEEIEDAFALPREEVRRRSLAGIFYLTSSSLLNLVIGFAASIVLARMLTPSDFGTVAIGSTALLIGGALADGGLGAGMVRRPAPPTRQELRTLNGIQLAFALTFCVPICLIALEFGRTGRGHCADGGIAPDHALADAGKDHAQSRDAVRPPACDRCLRPDVLSALCGCGSPAWGWGLGICLASSRARRRRHAAHAAADGSCGAPFAARLAFLRQSHPLRSELSGELVYIRRPRTGDQSRSRRHWRHYVTRRLVVHQPDLRPAVDRLQFALHRWLPGDV